VIWFATEKKGKSMFGRLIEAVLPRIIGVMVHKKEKLTARELVAQKNFLAKLKIQKRKTKNPVIVAIIGLVGSGKSSVARELAGHIGATVVNGDDVRIELRKQNERYDRAHLLAENIARGGNVILDSDFIDPKKRASLREKARMAKVGLVFVCTYAEPDVMFGRIISAEYKNVDEDFFGGASCKWKGNEQSKGAVVKMRELWRRTPHHYRWENKGGGQWIIKNPPCKVLADVDTTDEVEWKKEVGKLTEKLFK
jgi:predicted kinase